MNKHTEIKKHHKAAVEKICIAMNLVDVTTPRMEKNGSIRLYDTITKVQYSLSESGYVRRYIKGGWPSYNKIMPYQLNRKVGRGLYRNNRILASMDEQITILINSVASYR